MIMQVTGMCWCSVGVLCFNLARDDSTGGYEVGYYDALGTYIWETWSRYICGAGVNVVFAVICGDFAGVCVSGGVDGVLAGVWGDWPGASGLGLPAAQQWRKASLLPAGRRPSHGSTTLSCCCSLPICS